MTATGAVEGELEGHATFTQALLDQGIFSVNITDNSDFGLELRIDVEDGEVPDVGDYDVQAGGFSDQAFSVIFRDFSEGGMIDPDEYASISGGQGTIEISSASDDAVSGSFEAAVPSGFDAEDEDTVEVSGEFHAAKVQGGGMP